MTTGFVHTTGFAPELLYPGLKALWGDSYKQHEKKYDKFFSVKKSDKRFEKEQGMSGFTTAGVKDEGDSVPFHRLTQGFQKEYVHTTYGIGANITREMMEDDQYGYIQEIPRLLTEAMVRTEETIATGNLNNAFDGSVTGADGVSLCNAAHPNSGSAGGTQSNRPATAVDLTQTSLEDAYINIMNFRDENNQRIHIRPKKLVVSRSDYFNASKILQTEFKTGSADNDVNIISNLGLELIVTNYLTDQDAWFLCNGVANGLTFMTRREADFERDNDRAGTQNLAIVTTKRFDTGWTDWRDVYGSPGA